MRLISKGASFQTFFRGKDEDGKINFEEFCNVVGNTDVHKKMVVDVWSRSRRKTRSNSISGTATMNRGWTIYPVCVVPAIYPFPIIKKTTMQNPPTFIPFLTVYAS